MLSKEAFDRVMTGLLACCALVMTGLYARRELRKPPDPNAPVRIDDWEMYAVGNMRIGPANAAVTIVEFSDFQCPFCAQLAQSLKDLREIYPDDLQIIYRNFPIVQLHPFAPASARIAQCAANVGRFEEVHDYLFANVDSAGVESWGAIALKAGIPDTASLLACMDSPVTMASVSADSSAAIKAGIGGTPMVIVNGLRYAGAPSRETLDSIIKKELSR